MRGSVEVELVCGNCERREWHRVSPKDCGSCVEWDAITMGDGDWRHIDDSIVCSDPCADAIFGWDE